MELSPYEIAIISGGFTVIGVLFGAIVTNKLALGLAKKAAKREAGRRLLEAFSPELSRMCPTRDIYPGEIKKILIDAFLRHRQAMIEYSFHLNGAERIAFEKECREYFIQGGSDCLFKKYQTTSGSEDFHRDIESMLKYIET